MLKDALEKKLHHAMEEKAEKDGQSFAALQDAVDKKAEKAALRRLSDICKMMNLRVGALERNMTDLRSSTTETINTTFSRISAQLLRNCTAEARRGEPSLRPVVNEQHQTLTPACIAPHILSRAGCGRDRRVNGGLRLPVSYIRPRADAAVKREVGDSDGARAVVAGNG